MASSASSYRGITVVILSGQNRIRNIPYVLYKYYIIDAVINIMMSKYPVCLRKPWSQQKTEYDGIEKCTFSKITEKRFE